MNTCQIPEFTVIDLDDLEDYYDAQTDLKGRKVELDINFDEYSVDRQKLEAVTPFISQLTDYDEKARKAIEEDYLSGDTIKLYIQNHQELFNRNELTNKSSASDKSEIADQVAKLYLKRVGFYPENDSEFAVFDYTINEEETQYLVVVNFKKDGEIDYLTMES